MPWDILQIDEEDVMFSSEDDGDQASSEAALTFGEDEEL